MTVFMDSTIVVEQASVARWTKALQCTDISQIGASPMCPELGAPLFCRAPSQNQPCDTLYLEVFW